jgi:hypothetical protein
MKLTRRQVLAGAAASGLGAAGLYELVDRLTSSSKPVPRAQGRLQPEQHLLDGITLVRDNGVAVVVPPLHSAVVTARVVTTDLRSAQRELEEALVALEQRYAPTPAGLGVTVAWGLAYFHRYVPRQAGVHLPIDRRASRTKGHTVHALADAIRFPSDPAKTILEDHAARRARPAPDCELRDARIRRPRPEQLLPERHEHACVAPLRRPRLVVSDL